MFRQPLSGLRIAEWLQKMTKQSKLLNTGMPSCPQQASMMPCIQLPQASCKIATRSKFNWRPPSVRSPSVLISKPLLTIMTETSARNAVAAFCAKLKDNLLASQHPKQAVPILLAALKKLSPGPAYLTPLHAMVLEA